MGGTRRLEEYQLLGFVKDFFIFYCISVAYRLNGGNRAAGKARNSCICKGFLYFLLHISVVSPEWEKQGGWKIITCMRF
jgi:hypothetical protein